jgi:hypothetical protein
MISAHGQEIGRGTNRRDAMTPSYKIPHPSCGHPLPSDGRGTRWVVQDPSSTPASLTAAAIWNNSIHQHRCLCRSRGNDLPRRARARRGLVLIRDSSCPTEWTAVAADVSRLKLFPRRNNERTDVRCYQSDWPSPRSKAPEGWRTPRRFAFAEPRTNFRQVLDCGGPPPLFPDTIAGLLRGQHQSCAITAGHPSHCGWC